MKYYSFSDMNRLSGEILETALSEPVALTKYGKERLVLLSIDQYRKWDARGRQTAFTVEGAPDGINDELMEGLDGLLADEPKDA